MIQGLYGFLPQCTSPRFLPSFRRRTRVAVIAGSLALVGLCGCGPKRVRADFKNYESAFAETSNRELLLNLARLQNRDPTYFFKLGQITSSYRMQGNLTGSGQLTSASGAVQIPTGGGSPGLIYENDPTFQFIPVNDDTNAQLLLKPIPPETFYALYSQGWRVDQLFRLLVDRIEITRTPDNGGGCGVETIRNVLPPSYTTPEDQAALSRYITFLRVSALVYELQKKGILLLRGNNTFVPYDKGSTISAGSDKKAAHDQEQSPPNGPPPDHPSSSDSGGGGAFLAKDQNDAVSKDNLWVKTPAGWLLGHKVFTAVFYLSPLQEQDQTGSDGSTTKAFFSNPQTVYDELGDDMKPGGQLEALNDGPALMTMLNVMATGFSLEGTPNSAGADQDVCPAPGKASAHLFMRSLIGLMAAAAQEQKPFLTLAHNDPIIPDNPLETQTGAGLKQVPPPGPFSHEVPKIEQLPLLYLDWADKSDDPEPLPSPPPHTDPLIQLSYRKGDYLVADPKQPVDPNNEFWNRDMFRLIGTLTSQVTVDISKFPLPEILQLHSD
jgi:hypothetical protein